MQRLSSLKRYFTQKLKKSLESIEKYRKGYSVSIQHKIINEVLIDYKVKLITGDILEKALCSYFSQCMMKVGHVEKVDHFDKNTHCIWMILDMYSTYLKI